MSSLGQRWSRPSTLNYTPARQITQTIYHRRWANRPNLHSRLATSVRQIGSLHRGRVQKPNQSGDSQGGNQSLLVMMVVLVAVFFGMQYFRAKHNPQTASPTPRPSPPRKTSPPPPASPSPTPPRNPAHLPPLTRPLSPQCKPPLRPPPPSKTSSTASPFLTSGAQVYKLDSKKAYKDSYGQPLDLVHTYAAGSVRLPPLALYTYDSVADFKSSPGPCARTSLPQQAP